MKASPESLLYPGETAESFIADNHTAASLTDSLSLSFPDLSDPELPDSGWGTGTTMRFIFWRHMPEHQPSVIPLIEGADILVMESANRGAHKNIVEQQIKERTVKLNLDLLSILVTGQQEPKAAKRLARRDIDIEYYISLQGEERAEEIRGLARENVSNILVHYAGQMEKIFLVDLEHRDAEQFAESEKVTAQKSADLLEAIETSDASWTQLRVYALDYLKASGLENEFRERITAKQLESIARANPGKKIAVLYGRGHQLLSRQLEAPGVKLQRQFASIPPEKDDPLGERVTALHTGLEQSLRAGTYSHDHLDQYIALMLTGDFSDKLAAAIARMTPQHVSDVAAKLSELWEEPVEPDEDRDEDDESPHVLMQIVERRLQTETIFKRAAMANRVPGFLRRNS
jgi:hypothetical protein